MVTALITGVTGQDGWYITDALLDDGCRVVGLTRDAARASDALTPLAVRGLEIREFDYSTPGLIGGVIDDVAPDFIFNMASLATGQGMFERPAEMARINGMFVLDILEALCLSPRREAMSLVQASSSEMFGNPFETPQSETTPLRPLSPYGAAKQYAHTLIGIYRRAYGVRASSAILFNHESVRRPPVFVTKKIALGAARIRVGLDHELRLGSLNISRDWGYAPEYARAMIAMAHADRAEDYVVATGRLHSIGELVEIAFARAGLDWRSYVVVDPTFSRPIETLGQRGNPAKIAERLGWRSQTPFTRVIEEMVDHELVAAGAAAGSGGYARGRQ